MLMRLNGVGGNTVNIVINKNESKSIGNVAIKNNKTNSKEHCIIGKVKFGNYISEAPEYVYA